MGKKRIYEVAKELGVKSQQITEVLAKHNIDKTNFNAVDAKDMAIIEKTFAGGKARKKSGKPISDVKNNKSNGSEKKNQTGKKEAEKPSMIVKPVIVTVKTEDEKTTIIQRPVAKDEFKSTKEAGEKDNRNNGRADNRNNGRTDNRNNGRTDNRNNGRPDNRNNGRTDNRNNGRTDNRNNGRTDNRNNGRPDNRNNGRTDNRNNGRPDNRNNGRTDSRNNGRTDNRNNGRTDNRNNGRPDNRNNGRPDNRNNGRPDNRNNGRPDNRNNGRPDNRNNGRTDNRNNDRRNDSKVAVKEETPRNREVRKDLAKKHDKSGVKNNGGNRNNNKKARYNNSFNSDNNRNRKNKRNNPQPKQEQQKQIVRPKSVEIGESISVQDFAKLIKRDVSEIIKSLFLLGVMVTINQDIDFEMAELIGTEFGVEVKELPPEKDPTEVPEVEDDPKLRVERPPVVTVMGHVDHGKTSLLDSIRKSNVTSREAGGITQHIGAYSVNCQGKKIVFLDTPGHEAFTQMRARGAQCTDIAILVVAADDGVMPQTVEAINHAKAAKVPIIVAINKIDKPAANPEHVKQQLAEMQLIPEDWGGDTIMVPVSAHQKTGIEDLLEMVLLVAEVKELKANPEIPAHGTIIEAKLDKGRGPVATVLVQKGTLTIGDYILVGNTHGRVRALVNDRGEKVRKVGPSMPVEVLGLNEVPQAGDIMDGLDEKTARSIAEKRTARDKDQQQKAAKVSLDDIFSRIKEGELKELNIVIKADVQGTIEALRASLEKIQNEEVKVVVVHSGVGAVTESDVMLASAANALIIGYNVRPTANARKSAESEKVDIRSYRVIYDAINDVESAIKGMLAPKFKENIIGRVEVRQIFFFQKMPIAGCYVTEGKVTNNAQIRVVRDGIVISEDEIDTLRRFKDDAREVAAGYECGITLANFHDIKEGDVFEAFVMEEVAPK